MVTWAQIALECSTCLGSAWPATSLLLVLDHSELVPNLGFWVLALLIFRPCSQPSGPSLEICVL
jgi:hypothetical protein